MLHAAERDTARVQQARAAYQAVIQPLPLDRVKFIAESGMNLALTRLWGRAPRRERVVDVVPRNYGPNVTILAALSRQGIEAVMTVEGATDADVFRAYVEQVLGPTLLPAEVVVMDNLSAHKVHGIREGIEGQGAQLLYLPPYSPDLSPIEPCWSNLKGHLAGCQGTHPRSA